MTLGKLNKNPGFLSTSICAAIICSFLLTGCTVKTIGDPNRPVRIEAHITVDIRQLEEVASKIEDMVSIQEELISNTYEYPKYYIGR